MAHVLLVDDDTHTLTVLREILECEGYLVSSVQSVQQALDSCKADPPGVVLTDFWLSDGTGSDVRRELHVHSSSRVPVILLTAASDSMLPDAGGFAALVRKPFDIDHLLQVIEQALSAAAPRPPVYPTFPQGAGRREYL